MATRQQRYQQRRTGGTTIQISTPVIEQTQQQQSFAERSDAELKGLGRSLSQTQKSLGAQQSTLAHLQRRLADRQSEGKSSPGTEARIARVQAEIARLSEVYARESAALSPTQFSRARQLQPKDYFSGAGRQGATAQENAQIRAAQSEGFKVAKAEATREARVRAERELAASGRANYQDVKGDFYYAYAPEGGYSREQLYTPAPRQRTNGRAGAQVSTVPQRGSPRMGRGGGVLAGGSRVPLDSTFGVTGVALAGVLQGQTTARPSQARQIQAYEQRLIKAQRSQERFGQGMQNVENFAGVVTGGVNLNPFSNRFLMQTPYAARSTVGRYAQKTTGMLIGLPVAATRGTYQIGQNVAALGESLFQSRRGPQRTPEGNVISPTSPRGVRQELRGAARDLERGPFSFLPGGTPINVEGSATLTVAGLTAGLGTYAGTRAAPVLGRPSGPVRVSVRGRQQARFSSENPNVAVGIPTTTRIAYTAPVRGVLNRITNTQANVRTTVNPRGTQSTSYVVRGTRYTRTQRPGQAYSTLKITRNGKTTTRQLPPVRGGLLPIEVQQGRTQTTRAQLNERTIAQSAERTLTARGRGFPGDPIIEGQLTGGTRSRSLTQAQRGRVRFEEQRLQYTDPLTQPSVAGGELTGIRISGNRVQVYGRGQPPARPPSRLFQPKGRTVREQQRLRFGEEGEATRAIIESFSDPTLSRSLRLTNRGAVGEVVLRRATRERPLPRNLVEQDVLLQGELFFPKGRVPSPRTQGIGRRGELRFGNRNIFDQPSVTGPLRPGTFSPRIPANIFGGRISPIVVPFSGVVSRQGSRGVLNPFSREGSFTRAQTPPAFRQQQSPLMKQIQQDMQIIIPRTSGSSRQLTQQFFQPPTTPTPTGPSFIDLPGGIPPLFPPFLPRVKGDTRGGFKQGRSTRRNYRYAPSLTSLYFGITAKRSRTKQGGFTGLELRPVLV